MREVSGMRTALPLLTTAIATASLIALAGCNSQPKAPQVIDTNPDPMANELAHRAPVALPPAIKADKTFRCKDNSLVYVTFFQGDKQANVRLTQDGPATMLKADKAGDPMTAAGGWKVTGDETRVSVTAPGKPELSCKA